jgi:two-component system NarL family response regulator
MKRARVSVLCVDDHALVRECVVAFLESERSLRFTAEGCAVTDAVDSYTQDRPDVTLVSMQPRGLDCLRTIRGIRRVDPRARIVVYAREHTESVCLALEAGAAGFLLESDAPADLVRVVLEVYGRNGALPSDAGHRRGVRPEQPTLTAREVELLELLTLGHRTKAIAASLRLSDHTVKAHMKSVYEKLGVHGRAEALAEALRRGFVRLAASHHLSAVEGRVTTARPFDEERRATALHDAPG